LREEKCAIFKERKQLVYSQLTVGGSSGRNA
jgi:hypothetical protein